MNKKIKAQIKYSQAQKNALERLVPSIQRIQKKFNFKNVTVAFGLLSVNRKTQLSKFGIIEKIKTRKIHQAFLDLNIQKKNILLRKKNVAPCINLAFLALAQLIKKKQTNSKCQAFSNVKQLAVKLSISKLTVFIESIIKISSSFQRRALLINALQTIKRVQVNRIKKCKFFKTIDLYIKFCCKSYLEQSFSSIIREAFCKSHISSMKLKQQKILDAKNLNLNRNEIIRSLKTQIQSLSKAFQAQQTVRNRSKKQDYEKNLVLQAKTSQKNKNILELQRARYQNRSLNFQLSKKQEYLRAKEQEKNFGKNSFINWKTIYETLRSQKTKDNLGLKEFTMIIQKNGVEMAQDIKRFGLSKEYALMENIDLRNLVSLYEKEMPGFGITVNIKESQTFKRTMQQNVNLRQVVEILLYKVLQMEQKQLSTNREELKGLVESHNSSQKGSKLTLTTVSTAPF